MKRKWILWLSLLSLLVVGAALAAPLAYTLDWWTADSGGGSSTGGNYTLSGTIGQPDAGTLSGGSYQLGGGFWGGVGGVISPLHVYLPLTTKP